MHPKPYPQIKTTEKLIFLLLESTTLLESTRKKNTRQSTALTSEVPTVIFSIITKSLWTVRNSFFIIQTTYTELLNSKKKEKKLSFITSQLLSRKTKPQIIQKSGDALQVCKDDRNISKLP